MAADQITTVSLLYLDAMTKLEIRIRDLTAETNRMMGELSTSKIHSTYWPEPDNLADLDRAKQVTTGLMALLLALGDARKMYRNLVRESLSP